MMILSFTSGVNNDICQHGKDNYAIVVGLDHPQAAAELGHVSG
jgi:hypothetical protein